MGFLGKQCNSRRGACVKSDTWCLYFAVVLLWAFTTAAAGRPMQQDPEPEPERVLNCTLSRWRNTKVLVVQFNHLAPIETADEKDLQMSDLYHTARLYMPHFFRSQVSTTYTVVHKGFVEDAAVQLTPHFYKISIMNHMLRSYLQFDYFIWLDQDAMISNPDQQLVCLLEHWSVPPREATTAGTPILWIVRDPDAYHNYMTDAKGQQILNWNTGFMVWRNDDKSRQALQKWWEEALAHTEFHNFPFWDQSSFNGWIRPTFGPHDVYVIPCDEANGFGWMHEDSSSVKDTALKLWKKLVNRMHTDKAPQFNCQGRYITHAWRVKNAVGRIMRDRLIESVVETEFPDPLVIQANFSLAVQREDSSSGHSGERREQQVSTSNSGGEDGASNDVETLHLIASSGHSNDLHEQQVSTRSSGGEDGSDNNIETFQLRASTNSSSGEGAQYGNGAHDVQAVGSSSSLLSSGMPAQASISSVDLFARSSNDLAAGAWEGTAGSTSLVLDGTSGTAGSSAAFLLVNGEPQLISNIQDGGKAVLVVDSSLLVLRTGNSSSSSSGSSLEATDSSASADYSSSNLDVGLTVEEEELLPPA